MDLGPAAVTVSYSAEMSSAQAPPLHCPTCLQLCPAPVWLPCGHAFCPQCLQSMHQGLDRHCCPQCRAEYHPHYCYCYWYCNDLCNDLCNNLCNDPNPNTHHHMGPGRSNTQTSPAVKGSDAGGVDGAESNGYIKKGKVEENSPIRNPGASPGIVKMSLVGELDKNIKQNMSIAELHEDMYGKIGYRFQNKTPNKEGCSMNNFESPGTPGLDSIDQTLSAFKLGYPQEGEGGGFQNESQRKDNSSFGNVVNPVSPTLNISQYTSTTNGIHSQTFQNQSPVVDNCSINDLEIQEGSPSVVQMCGTAELDKSIGLKENPGSQNVVIKHNPDPMKTDMFQNKSLDVVKITGRLDKIEQIGQTMFAVKVKSDREVQNKMTHLTTLQMQQQSIDVQETNRFQNKSPLATGEINQTHQKSEKIQMGKSSFRFQNKTCDSSEIGSSKINPHKAIAANCGGMGSFQDDFQCRSQVESDLFHYLKSKVEPKYGVNEVSQDKTPLLKDNTKQRSGEFQNKTPLLSPNEGLSASMGNPQQDILAIMAERSGEHFAFQSQSPISMEDARKMDEYKSKLALKVPEFTDRLAKVELVLDREQRYHGNVTAANAKLRQNALKLVGDVTLFAQNFSDTVLALIEQQLGPGEKVISRRLEQASEMSERLKKTVRGAEDVLKEENSAFFMSRARSVEAEMEKCDEENRPEKPEIVEFDLTKLCPELERLGKEFRGRFAEVQRALRNAFNPSEVTFDPETLHPNLLLSDDLKTVTFSAKKQEYATTGKRFSSFLQVLSAQSFSSGRHRWELQLDGAPWIVGMCVASALPRSGLPSALETWPQSWCLMWNQNQLTAFDRSKATALQKSPGAARRLELILDRETGCISLHQLTQTTGRCHLQSFNIRTEEPLHLAYRMLSGDKGSVTICS